MEIASSRIPRGKCNINAAIHPHLILLLSQRPKNFNRQCLTSSNTFIQEKVFGKSHNAIIPTSDTDKSIISFLEMYAKRRKVQDVPSSGNGSQFLLVWKGKAIKMMHSKILSFPSFLPSLFPFFFLSLFLQTQVSLKRGAFKQRSPPWMQTLMFQISFRFYCSY